MDVQLLTQADFTLSKCGRPQAPSGLSVVYIYKGFLVQNVFAANTLTPTQTVVKEIIGDTTFCLRAIQMTSSAATAVSVQVQLPNGRFLISSLQSALQIAGYGSDRYLLSNQLPCPPGSKIQVTFQVTNTAAVQPLAILFEGAYKYYLKSGAESVCPAFESAGVLPRYLATPNQNIMAPCFMQGLGPATPDGFTDEEFVYSAPAATSIDVLNGPFTAIQSIYIGSDADFECRKLLFLVTAANTVTGGTFLGRIRLGSGYALTDDYIDVASYLGSAPFPHDFHIPAGDAVYMDLQLVDFSGTGLISIQMFLEGVKRRELVSA